MIRRRDRSRHVAVHEAGHAVVGRVLGLDCGSVTIQVNLVEAEGGYSILADPNVTLGRWDRIGRFRGDLERSVFRARIMAFMAGAEAEEVLLGTSQGGDNYDRAEIAAMFEEISHIDDGYRARSEIRLRQATRMLVIRHFGKIECLARALQAYGTLVADDAIRSVAGLPAATADVDYWVGMFDDAEVGESVSLAALAIGFVGQTEAAIEKHGNGSFKLREL